MSFFLKRRSSIQKLKLLLRDASEFYSIPIFSGLERAAVGGPGKPVKVGSSDENVHIFACTVHFISTLTITIGNILASCTHFVYINSFTSYTNLELVLIIPTDSSGI